MLKLKNDLQIFGFWAKIVHHWHAWGNGFPIRERSSVQFSKRIDYKLLIFFPELGKWGNFSRMDYPKTLTNVPPYNSLKWFKYYMRECCFNLCSIWWTRPRSQLWCLGKNLGFWKSVFAKGLLIVGQIFTPRSMIKPLWFFDPWANNLKGNGWHAKVIFVIVK